jgi:peptidoglycan hydrolase CwlO-like protein
MSAERWHESLRDDVERGMDRLIDRADAKIDEAERRRARAEDELDDLKVTYQRVLDSLFEERAKRAEAEHKLAHLAGQVEAAESMGRDA